MEETTLAIQEKRARLEFFAQTSTTVIIAVSTIWLPAMLLGYFAIAPVLVCIFTASGSRWVKEGAILYGRLIIGLGLLIGILTTYYWVRVVAAVGPLNVLEALAK